MDVLSEVLHAVRLTGAVYFQLHAGHPWISVTPSMKRIGPVMMPEAEHVIPFHMMLAGRVWAAPAKRTLAPVQVQAGDIIMFPFGDSHVLTSDPDHWSAPPADLGLYRRAARSDAPLTSLRLGGDGDEARFVCGYLGCDASPFNPLLSALPPMLVVGTRANEAKLTKDLLLAALDGKGTAKTGAETVLAKLSELMFVQALRQHLDDLPEDTLDWLCGIRDPHIGKALHAIHAEPSRDWSLERLARAAGMSRSAFAERFTRYAGVPPMHYLGQWRMQLAAKLLERRGASIAAVAERVGYSSEAAFKRAFKKFVGTTPGQWRSRSRAKQARVAEPRPAKAPTFAVP